jgi:hypothetical protein
MTTSNRKRPAALIHMLVAAVALSIPTSAVADGTGKPTLFIPSAVEQPDGTATFPLYRGTSRGRTVWYIVLVSSDGNDAQARGVSRAQKLANARGTAAVQKVGIVNGVVDFPATVDFSPVRQVTPGPQGFPPAAFNPGAVGEPGYTPLIQLPNGTILDAPHIANDSGQADKVVALDTQHGRVTYRETNGFQGGNAVKYVSTDASNPLAAALENATFAPQLDFAPFVGGDGTDSARASLAAFVNGQTGAGNPERQGLNSAVLDGLDPLNVLRWNPSQGRYSPLWDVNLTQWGADAVAHGQNLRQEDFGDVLNLAQDGVVTGPGGAAFGASGFIVNCPIVSSQN